MKKGDRGYFGRRNGEKTYGEIVKVNRKTIKVRQLEGRGTHRSYAEGTIWTLAPSLWTPDEAGRPAEVTRRPAPAPAAPRRPEAAILAELRGVEADLSPENLSCDGELSSWMVQQRGRALRGLRRRLVVELGREPTTAELLG